MNENIETAATAKEEVKTIGQFLKSCRQKKNISLKHISQHTKINVTQLELLEKDLLNDLPNKAYVRGYVKSYLKVLGNDQEEGLQKLDKTYEMLYPPSKSHQSNREEQAEGFTTIKIFLAAIIILLSLGIIIFINNTRQSNVPVKQAQEITPQVLTADTPLKSTVQADEGATVKIDPKNSIKKDNEEEKKAVISKPKKLQKVEKLEKAMLATKKVQAKIELKKDSKKKVEEINKEKEKVKFYPINTSLYTIDQEMSENEISKYLPSNIKKSLTADKQNVFLNAAGGDSWITYKKDNGKIRKLYLKKGQHLHLVGDDVQLFLGNVNATKIFLNNRPLKIISKTGVKSIIIPKEHKKKYVLPLFIFKDDGTVITSKEYLEETSSN